MPEPRLSIQPSRLRRLLARLMDIYSPSGKEEEILDFLHGYLKRRGLPVMRQPVDDHRDNLVVMPSDGSVRLALIGHVDTVVAHDLDHYGYERDGDQVLGLGAADMKGGCAAMVEAFVSLWEQGAIAAKGGIALALVVGEEEDGDGAERLVEDYHFPWAIIGEPTDLRPCLGQYGYLEIQLSSRGKSVHASLANLSQNPIEAMLRLISRITRHLGSRHPEVVYNIRDLFSSQAGFAVPDRCEAWIDAHFPPAAPAGEIILELEEILAQEQQGDPQLDASLRFATVHAGYELPEKGPVVESLRSVYARQALGWEPQDFPSHSDANLLWAAGVKPILLGPGQLEHAHVPEESVSFQQVFLAAEIYRDLMATMMIS